jgi:hypothetical protein
VCAAAPQHIPILGHVTWLLHRGAEWSPSASATTTCGAWSSKPWPLARCSSMRRLPGEGGGKKWLGGRVGREKSMENPWKRLKEMGKPWEISWKIVGEWCLMKIMVVGIVVQAFSVRITILQGFILKDIRVCKSMVAYRFDKPLYFFSRVDG